MGRPRGYSAGPDLNALDNEQLEELVLSNWAKLNQVLKYELTLLDVQRLMVLELSKGKTARPMVLRRLRSAISRQHSTRAAAALEEVIAVVKSADQLPGDTTLAETIEMIGIKGTQCWEVRHAWRVKNELELSR